MSIYIALIIHYHIPLHKWNYSGSIQAIGIISVLYAYFMIWHGFPIDWGNGTTTLFIHLFLGITKVIHNDFISISIMFLTPLVLVYVISLALFWILCALNGKINVTKENDVDLTTGKDIKGLNRNTDTT